MNLKKNLSIKATYLFFALTFEAHLVVDRKLSIEIFKINYRFAKGTTEIVDFLNSRGIKW